MTHNNDNINDYNRGKLSNGIKYVLIQDENITKTHISINVNVGNIHESSETKGLAHFLEHLLFMGNEKYKNEDDFAKQIDKFGGIYNAFTSTYITNYHVTINNDGIYDILDILCNFFINPIFSQDCIDREINSVNNEYLKNVNSSGSIFYEALHQISIPYTLYAKGFSVGNIESLNKITTADVREFFDTFYTTSNISICVISNKPISYIMTGITHTFEKIGICSVSEKNKYRELRLFELDNKINTQQYYSDEIEYFHVSINNSKRTISYVWEIDYYKLYSLYDIYIEYINVFSAMSIKNILQTRGFIENIKSYINDNKFIIIDITLTNYGSKNISTINCILFKYLNKLYNQIQQDGLVDIIETLETFVFNENKIDNDLDYCTLLASNISCIDEQQDLRTIDIDKYKNIKANIKNLKNLCDLPYKVIFSGRSLLDNNNVLYKRVRIIIPYYKVLLYKIIPNNNWFKKPDTLDSRVVDKECEKYNNTYTDIIDTKELLYIFNKILMSKNTLSKNTISNDICPKCINIDDSEQSGNIWHCFNNKDTNVYISINIHNINYTNTDENCFTTTTFVDILKYIINIDLYVLLLVYFTYTINFNIKTSSICITISTLNDHHIIKEFIIDKIFGYLKNFHECIANLDNKENIINNIIEKILFNLNNIDHETIFKFNAIEIEKMVHANSIYNKKSLGQQDIIKNINFENIDLLKNSSCRIFVYGNILIENAQYIFAKYNNYCNDFLHSDIIDSIKSDIVINKSYNSNFVNVLYKIDNTTCQKNIYYNEIMTQLIVSALHNDFFDYIRTKNQLGYVAKIDIVCIHTDSYINMLVVSDKNIKKVVHYINIFNSTCTKLIDIDKFNALIKNYKTKLFGHKTPTQQFYKYLETIDDDKRIYDFDKKHKLYAILKTITLDVFLEYITNSIILGNPIIRIIPKNN